MSQFDPILVERNPDIKQYRYKEKTKYMENMVLQQLFYSTRLTDDHFSLLYRLYIMKMTASYLGLANYLIKLDTIKQLIVSKI